MAQEGPSAGYYLPSLVFQPKGSSVLLWEILSQVIIVVLKIESLHSTV